MLRKVEGKRVFIIHGHDRKARNDLAKVLTDGGFDPVVLANQRRGIGSQTIIEKFEQEARLCNYAVALFTPDDKSIDELSGDDRYRARQNVLIELGWFFAYLGRSNVHIVVKGDKSVFDIPSDIVGCEVIYAGDSILRSKKRILERI